MHRTFFGYVNAELAENEDTQLRTRATSTLEKEFGVV